MRKRGGSFGDRIRETSKRIMRHKDTKTRKVTLSLYDRISIANPVDTGHSRLKWEVVRMPYGYKIYNDAPYIVVLEYGLYPKPPRNPNGKTTIDGFSKQAPKGFIRIAMKEEANAWK